MWNNLGIRETSMSHLWVQLLVKSPFPKKCQLLSRKLSSWAAGHYGSCSWQVQSRESGKFLEMNPAFTDHSRMKNPFYQTLALSKKGRKLYLLYQAQLFVVRGGISCSAEGTVLTAAHHAWRQLWKCSCTSAAARAQGHPHTLLRPLCAIKLKASPQPTIQSST